MNAVCAALRAGDLRMPLPQTLKVTPLGSAQQETLQCDQLLRLMPGKRGVFRARYRDRCVLAKIFLDSAARQAKRERAGYERLVAAQQPTPELIATLIFDGGSILLFEFLDNAQPLFREDSAPSDDELARLLDRLQSMYAAGIYQHDLHWGNFLWHQHTALVIDAGAVCGAAGQALSSAQIADNLGLLIAQFRRCDQQRVRDAIARHSLCTQFNMTLSALRSAAETHWQRRKQILLQKCFRDTTATVFAARLDRVHAYRRRYEGPDLLAFLREPDRFMARGSALKLGNSATVAMLPMDGRRVVIKRYNMKTGWHWLRRCTRPSRAWTSWRNAHWLELIGLHTPAPIAFLEMRCGPLRGRAYYLCEFVGGAALDSELAARQPTDREIEEMKNYFTVAAAEQLVHGDMKATNFLLADEQLSILDLDAMREVADSSRWRRLFQRDFARFARNFQGAHSGWIESLRSHVAALAGISK